MQCPGRTCTETATHLLSPPRRWQTGTIVMTAGFHTTSWSSVWTTNILYSKSKWTDPDYSLMHRLHDLSPNVPSSLAVLINNSQLATANSQSASDSESSDALNPAVRWDVAAAVSASLTCYNDVERVADFIWNGCILYCTCLSITVLSESTTDNHRHSLSDPLVHSLWLG